MEFRKFLAAADQGGDLHRVSANVSCRDIPARIQAEENGRNRAVVFENIDDYPGAVVGNAFGSTERINRSVDAANTEAFFTGIDAAIAAPKALDLSAGGESDYVVTADPNLIDHLPPIIHSEHDSTPYITSGVVLARHPETGREALFVNPGFTRRIEGMDAEESDALLQQLYDHATEERFTYRHKWRPGDLTLFDGRASMHSATGGYTSADHRTLWRAFMGGRYAA